MRYDVIAALQPGTAIRDKIERWNDDANERLISEGRPPISNYRDYIDTAIADPSVSPRNTPTVTDEDLMKTLQNVGRQ